MIALDLFCGAGGSSTGAKRAGVWVRYAVNHWQIAIKTHAANHRRTKHICSNVRNIDPRFFAGVDMIIASPECTNHSRAKGAKPRDEISRATAWEVVRYAKIIRPRYIVVENVPDFRLWQSYRDWLKQLSDLGYGIREQIINSVDHGVPQSRARLFVMAALDKQPAEVSPTTFPFRTAKEIVRWNEYPFRPVSEKSESTQRKVAEGIKNVGPNEPFLVVYYGSGPGWQSLDRPLRTVTTKDRFGLVVPSPDGHRIRMLQPDELLDAMGFPTDYKLYGSRRDKVCLLGNAVCPPVMESIVRTLVA